jgi:hypothetical protein
MSTCNSDEFDYFNFARRLGSPPVRLREKARRPAGDHFDFVRMIGSASTTSRLD